MSTRFNGRAFISLSALLLLCLMLITSVLLFVRQHTTSVAMLHTLIGSALLLTLGWHLKNNFSPLKNHLRPRIGGRLNLAAPVALFISLALLVLCLAEFRPFTAFYQWGSTLRAGDATEKSVKFSYTRINKTPANAMGDTLTIDLRKGPFFKWPQYAIWLETLDGQFIQPLFVTEKLGRNNFANKVTKRDPNQVFTSDPFELDEKQQEAIFAIEWDPATVSERTRPESLPVFLHQQHSNSAEDIFTLSNTRKIITDTLPTNTSTAISRSTGNLSPSTDEQVTSIDAYAGATVLDNFLLQSRSLKPLPKAFKVRFEINESFDFNTYYSSDRFPDDPIYSGNGYSAQPSVIYEAIIDSGTTQGFFPMKLIGRGHHSGRDGLIYPDLDQLTTATQIVDRIIVEIKPH